MLSIIHKKGRDATKMSVLIENSLVFGIDTGSAISSEPIKLFRRIFPNRKIYLQDVRLRTVKDEIF